MLTRLSQWTGPATSLRPLGRYANANERPEPEDYRPSAENWIGGESERGADAEGRRPGERLQVHMVWSYPGTKALCEVMVTSPSLWREAAALSFMSEGRHDVRPHMLTLFFAEDMRALPLVLAYGVRYLHAWCQSRRLQRGEAAIRAAAADALSVMYRKRARMSADDRAKSLGMKAERFRELRTVMLDAYARRLKEATVRYHTGRIHTWETVKSDTGNDDRSPAHPSRALPRVVGQLPDYDWAA